MWKVSDPSVSISVTNNVSSYLATAATNLKFLTVNDYTFVTNTTKTVTMDTTTATAKLHPYYAFVELRQLQHGREYNLNIFNSSATETVLSGSGKGKATLIQLDDSYTIAYPTISRRDNLTGISPSYLIKVQKFTSKMRLVAVLLVKTLHLELPTQARFSARGCRQ